MPSGQLIGLDQATLAELKTDFTAALKAVAVGGQSYTIASRTFTRADLAEIRDTLAEITYALDLLTGARSVRTHADFSRGR